MKTNVLLVPSLAVSRQVIVIAYRLLIYNIIVLATLHCCIEYTHIRGFLLRREQ